MARILIAEDDDTVRRYVHRTLERAGHEVLDASDGRVARSVLADASPDLILTDLMMPEFDGLELVQWVRTHHPDTPVIVMSGGDIGGLNNNLWMAGRLGAATTLRKPFSQDELICAIESVLGSHKAP